MPQSTESFNFSSSGVRLSHQTLHAPGQAMAKSVEQNIPLGAPYQEMLEDLTNDGNVNRTGEFDDNFLQTNQQG